MDISRRERSILVDFVEQVLCTGNPNDYEMHGLTNGWFYLNSRGNVGINLRNIPFGISKIVNVYAEDHNPSWGQDYLHLSASNQQRFAYECYTSAMNRTGVKEYKKYFKRKNNKKLIEKHTDELKRVKHKIETDTMRKLYLEKQLELLQK